MNTELSSLPNFALLCDELRDQTISDEDFARLEKQLMTDPAARKFYHRYTTLHAGLQQLVQLDELNEQHRVEKPKDSAIPKWIGLIAAVSASVIFGLALYWGNHRGRERIASTSVESSSVATILEGHQTRWNKIERNLDRQDGELRSLGTGIHTLKAGVAKLKLESNVELIVQSPSTFELFTDNQISLLRGRITANVPSEAHGFQVKTDTATVVDLGTRFGVTISDDRFETHVFEGKVQASILETNEMIELVRDEGITASKKDETIRVRTVKANPFNFVASWPEPSSLPTFEGQAEFLLVPPRSLRPRDCDLAGKRTLGVFEEKTNFRLPSSIAVSNPEPEGSDQFEPNQSIDAGMMVDCFFAHFEIPKQQRKPGESLSINGAITFDRAILGVAARDFASSELFESPHTRYRDLDQGWLESGSNKPFCAIESRLVRTARHFGFNSPRRLIAMISMTGLISSEFSSSRVRSSG